MWFDGVFNKKRLARVTNHNRGSNVVGVLLPIPDESIGKSSCLDLFEHSIGIGLDAERSDLDAVELFWLRRRFGVQRFSCSQQLVHLGAKRIHGLAVFGEPVHHIGMVAGDAALVPLSMADEHAVSCGIKVVLPAKIGT